MDEEYEEILEKLMGTIADSISQMTPIQRALCGIRSDGIMEESRNRFWIRYVLKEPGRLLLTREDLEEKGRKEEIKLLLLLEHSPFGFIGNGAEYGSPTR